MSIITKENILKVQAIKGYKMERFTSENDTSVEWIGLRMSEYAYTWFKIITYSEGETFASVSHKYSERTEKTHKGWNTIEYPTIVAFERILKEKK